MPELEVGLPITASQLEAELPPEILVRERVQKYFEFDKAGFSLALYLLTWTASIPAGVIANAIWNALRKNCAKKPPRKILINEVQIKFDKGEITRFVQRTIEYGQDCKKTKQ